jgi:hypothetical protein
MNFSKITTIHRRQSRSYHVPWLYEARGKTCQLQLHEQLKHSQREHMICTDETIFIYLYNVKDREHQTDNVIQEQNLWKVDKTMKDEI